MKKRLKVLLSAYACEPGRGSEPGVGWNMALHMARHHDVWVLTRANNRAAIEAAWGDNAPDGLHFIYHDLPRWAGWWKRGARGVQAYYYLWQLTAIRPLKRSHREVGFDVAHHVTFVKYWAPAAVAWLKIPYVWGFVGGGDSTPRTFLAGAHEGAQLYERGRDFARAVAEHDPLVRYTARHAAVTIAVTRATADRVCTLGAGDVRIQSQVALSAHELRALDQVTIEEQGNEMLFVGNLLFLKGVHLALRAFAKCRLDDWTFRIVGDGPERSRLEALTRKLGIQDRVMFDGERPRAEVWARMGRSGFVVHPSLHDSGAFVCLEAAALRKPVLCLDLAGPGMQVIPETGVKILARAPNQVVDEMANAMQRLAENAAWRRALGEAARRRVETEYRWERRAEWFADLYEAVCPIRERV